MRWPRAIIHLDLDAFYASVEQLRRPELRGLPVIVGGADPGHTARGVVSAASYEARRYGVHSAMPLSQALRLCPRAVLLPVDFPAYRRASAAVFSLARQVTPLVEPLSLDEAYLDVTATPGDPAETAMGLHDRILGETRLEASFGVATSKTLAKIASDLRKPRGFVVVPPGEEEAFLEPLPLRALPGLGPATERALSGLGLRTLGDLAQQPVALLERKLGRAAALSLSRRSRGIDTSAVTPPQAPKSISREETFGRDTDDLGQLRERLVHLCADVARSLRSAHLTARTVSLKLRYSDFTTITRQLTLGAPSDTEAALTAGAVALLSAAHRPGRPIRLLGAGVHNLEAAAQLDLFAEPVSARDRRIDATVDALRRRFGPEAMRRGAAAGETRDLDWHREDLAEPGDDA
ncbi:MAG TPA: DNA polymerase IV [Candidatus Binatia bacterium]|nr:DNA polymerase IV [Candidatus Binatia bacterium]